MPCRERPCKFHILLRNTPHKLPSEPITRERDSGRERERQRERERERKGMRDLGETAIIDIHYNFLCIYSFLMIMYIPNIAKYTMLMTY